MLNSVVRHVNWTMEVFGDLGGGLARRQGRFTLTCVAPAVAARPWNSGNDPARRLFQVLDLCLFEVCLSTPTARKAPTCMPPWKGPGPTAEPNADAGARHGAGGPNPARLTTARQPRGRRPAGEADGPACPPGGPGVRPGAARCCPLGVSKMWS